MSAQPRSTPPAPDHAAGQIGLGELLSDRAFALYLAGQTASGAGGALSSVALVFAVLSISRSASSLGLVLLARLPGGLAISGVIVALAGPGTSFLIDSATFAASSLTIALIPNTAATSSQRRTVLRDLRDGWSVVNARRWLLVYAGTRDGDQRARAQPVLRTRPPDRQTASRGSPGLVGDRARLRPRQPHRRASPTTGRHDDPCSPRC